MAYTIENLQGLLDARGMQGILSRGAPNYQSSMSANGNSLNDVGYNIQPDVGTQATPNIPNVAAPAPVATQPTNTNIGNAGVTQTDFDYWSKLNNINRDTSQLDADGKLAAARNQSDLQKSYEIASRNYGKAKDASKSNFANNGLLHSGGFVQDQANIGEDYARNAASLATTGQRAFEDIARQVAERKNLAEQQRLDIERQQAQAKANADLQRSLAEAQVKAYADFKSSLIGAPGAGAPGNLIPPGGVGVKPVQGPTISLGGAPIDDGSIAGRPWIETGGGSPTGGNYTDWVQDEQGNWYNRNDPVDYQRILDRKR